MDDTLRSEIRARSGGRCETWLTLPDGKSIRCTNPATEIHHLLTKGRGGGALDKAGETYHLIHLCHDCHTWSDGAKAYLNGMLIDGSCKWDKFLRRPVYVGMNPYLSKTYGPRAHVAQ